jgi:1-acyl-sn-glycerol-3-phosphate acyltransferase
METWDKMIENRSDNYQLPEIGEKFIDLEKVISSKNPHLLKIIPGFIIRYLKRITHIDQVNKAIYENRHKVGIDFVKAILNDFGATVHSVNLELVPKTGRFLIASNHPLGGPDGMALISEVGKVRNDILFPVNDILLYLPNLKPLFIPVNKHGSNSSNVRLFDQAFASENMILYFPAGLVSRKQKGIIKDLDWKKTFIAKAKKHQRDIIPVHIDGYNSDFFYNLANLRKKLGIKANIEMLYLVDEMYKQCDKKITITFGKPIPFSTFDKRFSDSEWAGKVKEYVYQLAENPNVSFNY